MQDLLEDLNPWTLLAMVYGVWWIISGVELSYDEERMSPLPKPLEIFFAIGLGLPYLAFMLGVVLWFLMYILGDNPWLMCIFSTAC